LAAGQKPQGAPRAAVLLFLIRLLSLLLMLLFLLRLLTAARRERCLPGARIG
jgi:hypothetical protein